MLLGEKRIDARLGGKPARGLRIGIVLDGGQNLRRKALVECRIRGDPCLGIHHRSHRIDRQAGARGINARHRLIEGRKKFRGGGEIMTVADNGAPRIVDHQKRALPDGDLVARHGDDRRGAGGHADDLDADFGRVLGKLVVDRDPVEHVAAWRVDRDGYWPVADIAQDRGHFLRCEPGAVPCLADLIEDRDLCWIVRCRRARQIGPTLQGGRRRIPFDASGPHEPVDARRLAKRHSVAPVSVVRAANRRRPACEPAL